MGFFERIKRGFRFISQAFTMGFENRILLKPSMYLIAGTIVYTVLWFLFLIATGIDLDSGLGYTLLALCSFGSFFIFYFCMGMTVHLVDKHLSGHSLSVKDAFEDAKQNVLAIGWLACISTIVQLLSNAAERAARQRGGIALIGKLVMNVIESLWTVASYLMLPIIIVEDKPFSASLKRASAIHKGNLLQIGIGEVGVQIATSLLSMFVGFLLGILVMLLAGIGGFLGMFLAFLVAGTVIALLMAFNIFVRMAYYTCLYHWAVATEQEGQAARAPGPLAAAMGA